MSGLYLGVDLGTTGVRCVAFDERLVPVASRYAECPVATAPGGIAEQDPTSWWQAVHQLVGSVVADLSRPDTVRAMAVSSQAITVVPVDSHGDALRPALSWLDQRGEAMVEQLLAELGPGLASRSGLPTLGAYTLPKLRWLARHEPETVAAARQFWSPHEYIAHRLTGRAVTDHTLGGGTMLQDLASGQWVPEFVAAAGLRADQLPDQAWAGTRAGLLLPAVAERWGLTDDVVVAVGAQDQKCAALAAGLAPDVMTVSLGTAAALEVMATEAVALPGVPTFPWLEPGVWVRETSSLTCGAAYRWFSRAMGGGTSFEDLNRAAAAALDRDADRPHFLPYLARQGRAAERQRWGKEPGGVFWGLSLDTDAGDLALSVLEGTVAELLGLQRRMDASPRTLRVFGGGAQSPLWCQLIADVLGSPVETLASHEAAAAGAAMLAMRASGHDVTQVLPTAVRYEPGPRAAGLRARAEQHLALVAELHA